MKRRSCRPTLDTNRFSHCSLLPLLHFIHVLFSFFFFIFIFLCFSCHHFANNPPPLFTSLSSGPPCLPIPPSSVSQFLDSLPSSLLCQSSITKHGLRFPRCTNFLFSLLLILSGDISLNPGPPLTHSSLVFSISDRLLSLLLNLTNLLSCKILSLTNTLIFFPSPKLGFLLTPFLLS